MPNFALPVPRLWMKNIKITFIHTISLASAIFTSTCARASIRMATVTRLKADNAHAYQGISLQQMLALSRVFFMVISTRYLLSCILQTVTMAWLMKNLTDSYLYRLIRYQMFIWRDTL
jgi:hypothetical protein